MMIYIDPSVFGYGFATGLLLGTVSSLLYQVLAAFVNWIRNS